MKFFNFFKIKSHRTASHLEKQSDKSDFNKSEIKKEKFIYNSDTTLLDVLNYIRDNSVQIGIHLKKPATQTEIENFEIQKVELPDDFKLLYKFSNGFETDHDLFRLVPLDEIIEFGFDKSYLVSDTSFHFTEYMIYCDTWSVDISKNNRNDYNIYNKTDTVVDLTNSLAEFLCVFINEGVYDGLYRWRETKQKNGK